jgi:hypothetical protein
LARSASTGRPAAAAQKLIDPFGRRQVHFDGGYCGTKAPELAGGRLNLGPVSGDE